MAEIIQRAYDEDDFDDICQLIDDVENEAENERQWSGSRPERSANINLDRATGAQKFFKHYFSAKTTYREHFFYRRFCIMRNMFMEILETIQTKYALFNIRKDITSLLGVNPYQKCTAALILLTYDIYGDKRE